MLAKIYVLRVTDGQSSAAEDALARLSRLIAASDGCLDVQAFRGDDAAQELVLIERWASEEAYAAAAARFPKGALSELMAALCAPPQVRTLHAL